MPRRKIDLVQPHYENNDLVAKFVEELKNEKESGQPFIYEMEIAPGRLRVTVIWDQWNDENIEDRTAVILRAYEVALPELHKKIFLASGLTVPEATEADLLPYEIIPALRKSDEVTRDECEHAMLAEGASKLFGPKYIRLRVATSEEAEACRQRLIKALPKSEEVWLINKDLGVRDSLRFQHLWDGEEE